MAEQAWVAEWTAPVAWDYDEESVAWLRSRPESIKRLILLFPPSCVVRATRPLAIPRPGSVGIVTSWFEGGTVSVRQSPDSEQRAQCEPEWLDVVGYWRGLTPEVMERCILADEFWGLPSTAPSPIKVRFLGAEREFVFARWHDRPANVYRCTIGGLDFNLWTTDNVGWHGDASERVKTPFMVDYESPQAAVSALEEALRPLAKELSILVEARRG